MSDEPAKPILPPEIKERIDAIINREGAPKVGDADGSKDLDIGIVAQDARVAMRFTKTIHWFDMTPEMAVDVAEALITAAEHARAQGIKMAKEATQLGLADLGYNAGEAPS